MSGRSNIFAKDAGALKPLEGSNPSGSANSGLEHSREKMRRREAPMTWANPHQTRTPPGFSTLHVAPRCQCKNKYGNIVVYSIEQLTPFLLQFLNCNS